MEKAHQSILCYFVWIFLRERTHSQLPSSWPLHLCFNWLSKITPAHPSVPPQSRNPGDEAATYTWGRALRGSRCSRATSALLQNTRSLSLCGLALQLYVKPMWEGSTLQSGASEMWSKWEAGCSFHTDGCSQVLFVSSTPVNICRVRRLASL